MKDPDVNRIYVMVAAWKEPDRIRDCYGEMINKLRGDN